MFLILIILSSIFDDSIAYLGILGNKNITPMENFNKSAFAGVWYTASSSLNPFEAYQNCPAFTFSLNQQTGSFNVVLSTKSAITKKYRIQSASNNAVENHPSIFNGLYDYVIPMGQVVILDTDYKNYAVTALVYPKFTSNFLQVFWIFSRTPKLSSEYYDIASQVLAANHISTNILKPAKQIDC